MSVARFHGDPRGSWIRKNSVGRVAAGTWQLELRRVLARPMSDVAVAWSLHQPVVTGVGTRGGLLRQVVRLIA